MMMYGRAEKYKIIKILVFGGFWVCFVVVVFVFFWGGVCCGRVNW